VEIMRKVRATATFFTVLLTVIVTSVTIFYDKGSAQAGDEIWVKRYNGPAKGDDFARAMAMDKSGNVYVTGESPGSGSYRDYATIKYSGSGNQLWAARYNGPGNRDDFATAVAVDGSGNVYVTGYSKAPGTGYDYTTIKYNSSGKQLWVKRYNGPGNGDDFASALAVDGSGNVYVTGESPGSSSYRDFATIKYGSSGNLVWVKRFNGPGNGDDGAQAISVDSAGHVFVSGYSKDSGTGYDYTVIKY
jgi:hypothetical protein